MKSDSNRFAVGEGHLYIPTHCLYLIGNELVSVLLPPVGGQREFLCLSLLVALLLIVICVFSCLSSAAQTITAKEKAYYKQLYIQTAKDLNAQMPIIIDEYTTVYSVTFMNWVYSYNFRINLDCSSVSKSDMNQVLAEQRKSTIIEQRKIIDTGRYGCSRSQMKQAFKILNLVFRYNYYDINGSFLGSFEYTYKDF